MLCKQLFQSKKISKIFIRKTLIILVSADLKFNYRSTKQGDQLCLFLEFKLKSTFSVSHIFTVIRNPAPSFSRAWLRVGLRIVWVVNPELIHNSGQASFCSAFYKMPFAVMKLLTLLTLSSTTLFKEAEGGNCESDTLLSYIRRVPTVPVERKQGGGGEDRGERVAVMINVSLHIETMRDIASQVTLDFYLIQKWRDRRLLPIFGKMLSRTLWEITGVSLSAPKNAINTTNRTTKNNENLNQFCCLKFKKKCFLSFFFLLFF